MQPSCLLRSMFLMSALMLILAPSAFAISYTFTIIPGTEAAGINNSAQIVGTDATDHGFLLSGGNSSSFAVPGSFATEAADINNAGQIVGRFFTDPTTQPATHGFLLSGGIFTTLDPPGSLLGPGGFTDGAEAFGINDAGQIVGWFQGSTPITHEVHGFLLSGGSFSLIDSPSPFGTMALRINNAGQIVGSTGQHGFLDNGGSFTSIDVPGSSTTVAAGINDSGQIIGWFVIGSEVHGFLFSGGSFTTLDVPGSTFTEVFGINDAGQVVGRFTDASGTHGFLATPMPEPGTLVLLITGLVRLLGYRWRRRDRNRRRVLEPLPAVAT